MRYWDSSALVPLLVRQDPSARMKDIASQDVVVVTWWGSSVECVSALARAEREERLSAAAFADAVTRLRRAAAAWTEVVPSGNVRDQAIRLLRVHPLRAADAAQLAAAIVAADFQPASLEFVTLDPRQAEVAEREGFRVIT
jgi:predicted nucleic acid-binding protein